MSSYRTGADAELLAALRLKRLGYLVHLAGHKSEQRDGVRIPYGADLFGLFDLVALGAYDTLWVQVKAVRGMTSPPAWWRQTVEALPAPAGTSYELWLLAGDHWRVCRRVRFQWWEEDVPC